MATYESFNRVFNCYPAEGSEGENMNETTGKIEKRGEKDGKLSIFVSGQWYSQFFNNNKITPETKEGMEKCQVGETWHIGWVASGDQGQWRNIEAMEREIDVNEETGPTTRQRRTPDSKNKAFALSYAKDAVTAVEVALIASGGQFEGYDEMKMKIVNMAASFTAILDAE